MIVVVKMTLSLKKLHGPTQANYHGNSTPASSIHHLQEGLPQKLPHEIEMAIECLYYRHQRRKEEMTLMKYFTQTGVSEYIS